MLLSPLIGRAYECAVGEESWVSLISSISKEFNIRTVSLSHIDPLSGRVSQDKNVGFDDHLLREYTKYWDSGNPWRKAVHQFYFPVTQKRELGIFHGARVVNPRALKKSTSYRASLKKMDLSDFVAIPVIAGLKNGLGISLYCNHDREVFSNEELRAFNVLRPHFLRAGSIAEKLASDRTMLANPSSEAHAIPSILITANYEVIDYNAAADAQIFDCQLATIQGGKLSLANPQAHMALQDFIADNTYQNYLPEKAPRTCSVALSDTVSITATKLISEWTQVTRPQRPEILITFNDTRVALEPVITQIVATYSLTPTERAIFEMMMTGLSLDEISKIRGTSLSTIRWHVKKIYNKFDVSSLSGLFQVLLTYITKPIDHG